MQNDKNKTKKLFGNRKKIITAIVCGVLAVAVLITVGVNLIVNAIKNTGDYLRKDIAIESSDIKIDNAMMSYYFMNACYSFVNSDDYNNQFDLSDDLKKQQKSDGVSWYDYFIDIAESRAEQAILFSSEAKQNGMSLTDKEIKEIDEKCNQIDPDNIRQGVKKSDIKKCMEMNALADKYYDSVKSKVKTDEKTVREYVFSHPDEFNTVNYRHHSLNCADEKQQADGFDKMTAEKYVNSFKKIKNEKQFDVWLKDFFKNEYRDWTDADIEEQTEYSYNNAITYSSDDKEISDWLFDSKRKVNDILAKYNSETAVYDFYLVTKTKSIDDEKLQTVRHMLFTTAVYETDKETKLKAKEVLQMYKKGKQTEESFSKLVEKYSEDTSSATNGGLCEDFKKGDMVEAFEKWAFKKGRQKGDTGIVKTEYGYHIIYYVGNKPSWYEDGKTKYLENWHEDLVNSLKQKYKITKHPQNIAKIEQEWS